MFELKTETREIDGTEFTVTQFPAMKALEVMASLQNASVGMDPSVKLGQIVTGKMDAAAQKKMVLDVLQCTQALVREPTMKLIALTDQKAIDQIFSGRLRTMFKVIEFAVEVNYGDFKDGSEVSAPLTLTQDQ